MNHLRNNFLKKIAVDLVGFHSQVLVSVFCVPGIVQN